MFTKRWKLVSLLLSLVFILSIGLAGCGGGSDNDKKDNAAGDADKKYVFKLGHLQNEQHPYHLGSLKFGEILEKKTNGKIKIDVYPSALLGSQRDLLEGMQLGTVDMHFGSVAPFANFAPKLNVLSMPYIFKDKETGRAVVDSEIGKELAKPLEDKGIKLLAYGENGFRHFTNNKRPIKSPADMKGLKIRVMEAPVYVSMVKAFGADPTPMAWGELFTALQQGTVDGQENTLPNILSGRFNEVQKYLSLNAHSYDAAPIAISKKLFDSLPQDLQKAVQEAANEMVAWQRGEVDKQEPETIKKLKELGMQVEENVDQAAFVKASEAAWKEMEATVGKDTIDKIVNFKK